jgi:hypothetical protein
MYAHLLQSIKFEHSQYQPYFKEYFFPLYALFRTDS